MAPRKKRVIEPLAPDDTRHGTPNAYTNYGCRCQECRKAWEAYPPRKRAVRRWRARAGIVKPRTPVDEATPADAGAESG